MSFQAWSTTNGQANYQQPINSETASIVPEKPKSSKFRKIVSRIRKNLTPKNSKYTPFNIVACILSTIGLIWQVYQVSEVYYSYQTRVDIIISTPQALIIPGLTVCLDVIPNKTVLQSYFPSMRLDYGSLSSRTTYLPINVINQLEVPNVTMMCRSPVPSTLAGSADTCESFAEPRITIHSSSKYETVKKCTTYFYNNDTDNPIRMVDIDAREFFSLNIYSEANESILVYVHSPMEIVPMEEADSFHFYTKQLNRMVVTSSKIVTKLLKAPYRTNCASYDGIEYGRSGCIYNCRLALALKNCERWPYNVPAPTTTELPFRIPGRPCANPRRFSCANKSVCQSQCENVWYTTSLTYMRDKRDPVDPVTRFSVRRPIGIELEYIYGPRLDKIEFLCYIASCFGIWMGISVFDLALFTVKVTVSKTPHRVNMKNLKLDYKSVKGNFNLPKKQKTKSYF